MNRLTEKYSGTHVCYKNEYGNTVLCGEMTVPQINECMDRLKAYEDTGLEPEEVLTSDEMREINIKLGTLIDYINLEEQGRLHIAPIAEGTTIYVPFTGLNEADLEDDILVTTYAYGLTEFENGEMNKDWFLTKEEAEKALEGVDDKTAAIPAFMTKPMNIPAIEANKQGTSKKEYI